MFLADQHTHSVCSPDAEYGMAELALAGAERGLDLLCITDHVDTVDCDTAIFDPGCFERIRDRQAEEFLAAREAAGDRIELRLGLELGEINQQPELARAIVSARDFDFIIGSLHALRGMADFRQLKYDSIEQCQRLTAEYFSQLWELTSEDSFDVIGHIGYTNRYMERAGFHVDMLGYCEQLEAIFRRLIYSGRGIEVNSSGLRQGSGTTFPQREILKLYRELGGEIITIGSDAHFPRDVGADIRECTELIKSLGFEYVTVFRARRAEFEKI